MLKKSVENKKNIYLIILQLHIYTRINMYFLVRKRTKLSDFIPLQVTILYFKTVVFAHQHIKINTALMPFRGHIFARIWKISIPKRFRYIALTLWRLWISQSLVLLPLIFKGKK